MFILHIHAALNFFNELIEVLQLQNVIYLKWFLLAFIIIVEWPFILPYSMNVKRLDISLNDACFYIPEYFTKS